MKRLVLIAAFLTFGSFTQIANAAVAQHDAANDPREVACTSDQMPAGNTDCLATPSVFKAKIYEMGACTAHPFANGTGVSMDKTTCSVLFTNAAGFEVDIAATLGGEPDALEGETFSPTEGVFKYPYIILRPSFEFNAVVKNTSGTAYTSNGTGGAVLVGNAGAANSTDTLDNFDQTANPPTICTSGFINSPINIGTIDGYLTNDTYVRRATTDFAAGKCTGHTRLVAIIDLTTPFTITPATRKMTFKFNLTNYGAAAGQNGANGPIDSISTSPFSGIFETSE